MLVFLERCLVVAVFLFHKFAAFIDEQAAFAIIDEIILDTIPEEEANAANKFPS